MIDGQLILLVIGMIAVIGLIGWERRRIVERRELERRMAELTTLSDAGRAIAEARLDVDALCELIYEQASQIVNTSTFQIGLFEGNKYDIRLWFRSGERRAPEKFDLTQDTGIIGWMRESKEALLVRDFERELDTLPARPRYLSDDPPRSAVFVPIVAAEEVIGAVAIQNDQPQAFDEEHLRLLSIIANQAAPVIANARLLETERRRVAQLQMIGEVGRQVAAILELDVLFDKVVELIKSNFNYYSVSIIIRKGDSDLLVFEGTTSPQIKGRLIEVGQGICGTVVQSGQAILANDVSQEPHYHQTDSLPETRSELAVPLIFGDNVLGVLNIESRRLNAFDQEDVFILRTLADQIAIAIHEARLYEAEREQAWISTALLQVADATVQASNIDDVLETVTRITLLLAGVDRCGILLWEPDTRVYRGAKSFGLEADAQAETFNALRLAEADAPDLQPAHESSEMIWLDADSNWVSQAFGKGMTLACPLYARGELAGVMLVGTSEGVELSQRKGSLLSGIANQAALAIESAQLLAAQREEAWVSMALLQVAEAVGSQTELSDVLVTVVRLIPLLVGVDACLIFLVDESQKTLYGGETYGLPRERLATFEGLNIPEEEWQFDQDRASVPVEVTDLLGLRAPQAWTMQARGDIVGVMIIDGDAEGLTGGSRRANILTGIVSQTAIAIVNSRLADEITAREGLEQELRLARDIQQSFLPEHSPRLAGWEFAALWRSARQVGGDFYDFIPMGENGERLGVVIADVADKGVPAALFMALSRTLLRAVAIGGRDPADALLRANELMLGDARSELFVTMFYITLDISSAHLCYANAGHNPPLLMRAAGPTPQYLVEHGTALGVVSDISLDEVPLIMEVGDVLILYTDGVTEAINDRDEEFGTERLERAVQSCMHGTADDVVQALDDAIRAHVGSEAPFDDITLVVMKRVNE